MILSNNARGHTMTSYIFNIKHYLNLKTFILYIKYIYTAGRYIKNTVGGNSMLELVFHKCSCNSRKHYLI